MEPLTIISKELNDIPNVRDGDILHEIPVPDYSRFQKTDRIGVTISHSGTFVANTPRPDLWVNRPIAYWHDQAKPVIEYFKRKPNKPIETFFPAEKDISKVVDTEGDMVILGERHVFGGAIAAFSEWMKETYKIDVIGPRERSHIVGKSKVVPDITVFKHTKNTDSTISITNLTAIDFKTQGPVISYRYKNIRSKEAAEELIKSEPDYKDARTGEGNYNVVVQKCTGYALALRTPITCLYDYKSLVIHCCPLERDGESNPFGQWSYRTLIQTTIPQSTLLPRNIMSRFKLFGQSPSFSFVWRPLLFNSHFVLSYRFGGPQGPPFAFTAFVS